MTAVRQAHFLDAKQRLNEAMKMKMARHTYQEIADACGYNTRQAVHKAIKDALGKAIEEVATNAEVLRQEHLMELDRLQLAAWPKAIGGDLKAIETVLKIMNQRAELQGVKAAIRHEVAFTEDEVDIAIRKLTAQLAELDAARQADAATRAAAAGS